MFRFSRTVSAGLLVAGVLGLTSCANETPRAPVAEEAAPEEHQREDAPAAELHAEEVDTDDFNKSGVVMMLESQLGVFGGTGRWDGDTLTVEFDRELDGSDGLDLAFVCGFMDSLVLDSHTTTVETPSGETSCVT